MKAVASSSSPNGGSGGDEAAFRVAYEDSPEPFELLRPLRRGKRVVDFVWVYANPAAAQMLRCDRSALLGHTLLGQGDVSFGAARCSHWAEVLEHGAPRRADFSQSTPSGEVAWYQTLSYPTGECVAASTRNLSAESAETKSRGPGWSDDLLASVSHELRTPLNAIVGWAHLLGRAEADTALTQRAADAIGRNARALASLVDDLLDINRIVTGTLRLDRQRCDLSAAVLRAVEAVRPAAQARWIQLVTDEVAPALISRGDAKRFEQLLGNLLTRAVQSTPLDGAVHVSARADDGRARIVVRDGGESIAHDALPHLPERFGEADSTASRRHGGLGLGLAIVRSLVELHGGVLNVRGEGGGLGTTVEVDLPLAEGAEAAEGFAAGRAVAGAGAADSAAGATLPQPNSDSPLAWRRILVLEDEADSLELMTVLLRQQGAIVQAFDNAEQALAAAENATFDLIISDLGMAGMDGLEFMRRLKRRPVPIRAMALTAYAGDAQRALALDAGYSRVEVKPISPPEFLAVVVAEAGRGTAAPAAVFGTG